MTAEIDATVFGWVITGLRWWGEERLFREALKSE
jgi:hypothetical protein